VHACVARFTVLDVYSAHDAGLLITRVRYSHWSHYLKELIDR
jgi:hypothetical protein